MKETTLQPGVQNIISDPDSGSSVCLLVDYEGDEEAAITSLQDSGAEINKSLIRSTISVSVDESNVTEVSDLPMVTYVEVEGKSKPQTDLPQNKQGFL